jgi:hypothetical protein
VVSANPDEMDGCAAACDELDMSLAEGHGSLYQAFYGFKTTNLWGILNADALIEGTGSWILANSKDSRFLHTVAQVFRDADARGAAVADADVWAALEAAGFGPEGGSRVDLTVTPSTAMGGMQTTGYAVDPVSTASGNLFEPRWTWPSGPLWAGCRCGAPTTASTRKWGRSVRGNRRGRRPGWCWSVQGGWRRCGARTGSGPRSPAGGHGRRVRSSARHDHSLSRTLRAKLWSAHRNWE